MLLGATRLQMKAGENEGSVLADMECLSTMAVVLQKFSGEKQNRSLEKH